MHSLQHPLFQVLTISNWRLLFILLGILGLIWVVVWSMVFTDYPEDNKRISEEELQSIRSTEDSLNVEKTVDTEQSKEKWYHFFTNTTLICNMLGYFGFQYVNFLILTWTPKYLQDEYHFEIIHYGI